MSSDPSRIDSTSRNAGPESGAARLTHNEGANRLIWDMRYPGAWDANVRTSGRRGPMAPPGTYTIRLRAGEVTQSRKLVLHADPRVLNDGVSPQIMREQLAHNLRVRDLLSEANRAVHDLSELRKNAASSPAGSQLREKIDRIDRVLVTPPVRYSRPGLQSQIQYLNSAMTNADQQVSRDAASRYIILKRELDAVKKDIAEARALAR